MTKQPFDFFSESPMLETEDDFLDEAIRLLTIGQKGFEFEHRLTKEIISSHFKTTPQDTQA